MRSGWDDKLNLLRFDGCFSFSCFSVLLLVHFALRSCPCLFGCPSLFLVLSGLLFAGVFFFDVCLVWSVSFFFVARCPASYGRARTLSATLGERTLHPHRATCLVPSAQQQTAGKCFLHPCSSFCLPDPPTRNTCPNSSTLTLSDLCLLLSAPPPSPPSRVSLNERGAYSWTSSAWLPSLSSHPDVFQRRLAWVGGGRWGEARGVWPKFGEGGQAR